MAPTATVPPGGIGWGVGPSASQLAAGQAVKGGFIQKVLTPANLSAVLAGVQARGILRRGREAEDIAKQRAAIDRANAEAVRRASIERAKILAERGKRFKARQVAQFISGGIRTDVGVPLLVEAQARADIAQDIGFILETGRAETGQFLSSALLEKRIGRAKKRRSRWQAVGVGIERGLPFLGR